MDIQPDPAAIERGHTHLMNALLGRQPLDRDQTAAVCWVLTSLQSARELAAPDTVSDPFRAGVMLALLDQTGTTLATLGGA
jgi:hypothetical protein